MKLLLIGGTGILSTDIRELALENGIDVYILNRGRKEKERLDSRIHVIIGNVRNVDDTKEKIKDLYFDVVIDFLSYTKEQLENTLSIFNKKCDQFIFISSATVYRKTEPNEKITENTELYNPDWEYSLDKIECEKLLEENYKANRQNYTIIRPYVTYSNKRIPFAIIPQHKQWSLANRIILGKPVVLWDGGKAICTLTSTKDFAEGMLGLFKNEKAYQEAFHITTDKTLTWKQALEYIGQAIGKEPIIADISSDFISKEMPELKGVLYGDKGLNRVFDNTKIKSITDFNPKIEFKDGIKDTIKYYREHDYMRTVDYEWDARMDNLIEKYYKNIKHKFENKKIISNKLHNENQTFKEKIIYYLCRNDLTYNIYKKIKRKLRS